MRCLIVTLLLSISVQLLGQQISSEFEAFRSGIEGTPGDGFQRESTQSGLVQDYLAERDLSTLSLDQLAYCYSELCPDLGSVGRTKRVWSGLVTPPRDGAYTFSINPLNPNSEGPADHYLRHRVKVWVDGQLVIDTGPDEWRPAGQPIALSAGEPVSLRMEAVLELNKSSLWDAHDQLLWAGPGLPKSIVPASALQQADGAAGLLYHFEAWADEERYEHQAIVRLIDGYRPKEKGPPKSYELGEQLLNELSAKWRESVIAFVDAVRRDQANLPPHPIEHNWSWLKLAELSTPQRLECVRAALDRPEVLHDFHITALHFFYRTFHSGIEDESLDFVAAWMAHHANDTSHVTASYHDFHMRNRLHYRLMNESLVWERPESVAAFEQRCLENEAGECSVPATIVLGYCYLVQGKIEEWIERLESRLRDPDIAGDLRVNWLIARATAEELRRCPAARHYSGRERLGAGRAWLEEAEANAASPENARQVAIERLARHTALGEWGSASALVESNAQLAGFADQVDGFRQQAEAQEAAQKTQRRAAYLSELERRRDRAAAKEDSDDPR